MDTKINIKPLIVNTYDFGGAATACIRLHKGLQKENIDSKLLLKYREDFNIPSVYKFVPQYKIPSLKEKINRKYRIIAKELKLITSTESSISEEEKFIKTRDRELTGYSFPYSNIDLTTSETYKNANIINLHWVADFINWQTFFSKNIKPVVWTLHDQNPFLGGEHYAERFLGIDKKGEPIKREYTEEELLMERRIIDYKKEILFNVKNLHIVAPSLWLKRESKNSELFSKYPHYHVPYGFPTDVFKPYSKEFCREVLGLPKRKMILLFVSEVLKNERKGYKYLQKALKNIAPKYLDDVVLCSIGQKSNHTHQGNVLELGSIKDERLMAVAYGAADAFIIPSLEDNLPNTMIESILCGTPVIGFNTGGISDVVINNYTGFLAPKISVNALKDTIELFLENSKQFNRDKIATDAKAKYDLSLQAKAYVNLFEEIASKNS